MKQSKDFHLSMFFVQKQLLLFSGTRKLPLWSSFELECVLTELSVCGIASADLNPSAALWIQEDLFLGVFSDSS